LNFHDKIVLVPAARAAWDAKVTMAFLEAGASVVVTYRSAEEFAAVVSAAEESADAAGWSCGRRDDAASR